MGSGKLRRIFPIVQTTASKSSMDAIWTIELLGGLRPRRDGHAIVRFRTHKTAALLAYLAYYPHRPHPRELLVEMLWPESDLTSGRQSLSMALTSLRQQLEPPGLGAGSVIISDRAAVQLNPLAISTDVSEFEQALKRAAQASGEASRIQCLSDAVELYSGDLLPGFYEEWVVVEQQRLELLFTRAGLELMRLLERRGESAAAIEIGHRLTARTPLSDPFRDEIQRLTAADATVSKPATRSDRPASLRSTSSTPRTESGSELHEESSESSPRHWPRFRLPAGTVSFLHADLEPAPKAGKENRADEDLLETLRPILRLHGGFEIGARGEPLLAAFAHASSAISCAVRCQRAAREEGSVGTALAARLRIAVDTGEPELKGSEYHGIVLQNLVRLLMASNGGQIVCSETTAAIIGNTPESGVALVDLGVYSLGQLRFSASGIDAPTRIFQVNDPGTKPTEFPRLKARPFNTGNIPLQFTRFFGRSDELKRLDELLSPGHRASRPQISGRPVSSAPGLAEEPVSPAPGGPDQASPVPGGDEGELSCCRLVTLTGPGGTGKTRLALEAAAQAARRFIGAAWLVPLAEIGDPSLLPGAIVQAMRLPHAGGVETVDQLVDALLDLRGDPLLLVLDNFEQLAEAGAPVIDQLLHRVPRLTCLVTSRRRLGLEAEQELSLHPLDIPTGGRSAQQLSSFPSVQLFIDRAQAVRPDFQITSANAEIIAEICRKLEGIPLAIELAAARAQVLTTSQILEQLKRRLDFLTTRRSPRPERHRTLRAAIDWSFHLLSQPLREFFARISIFRGSWTLEAAEAICAGTETSWESDMLAELEDCSLISVEEAHDEIRFRMLEMLREYAEEQLPTDERQQHAARHANYYREYAQRAQLNLWGPDQADWLAHLESEHDNLRAALEWSVGQDPENACLIAAGLAEFWEVRGYWSEGRLWCERILSGLPGGAGRQRGRVLCAAASLAALQADYEHAEELLEESLSLARNQQDSAGVAAALHKRGDVAFFKGEYELSTRLLGESAAIYRQQGALHGAAGCLYTLGRIAGHHNDRDRCRELWKESLAMSRQIGEKRGIALCLDGLANIDMSDQEAEIAEMYRQESLAIRREIGDRSGVAASLASLGRMQGILGNFEAARLLLEESLAIYRELGDRSGVAYLLQCMAGLADQMGDPETAGRLFEQSLGIVRGVGHRWQISQALQGLARVAYIYGEYGAAIRHLDESLTITRELDAPVEAAAALRSLSINAYRQGDYAMARYFSEECLAIRRKQQDPHSVAQALYHLGVAAAGMGDWEGAAGALLDGLHIYIRHEDLKGALYVTESLAAMEALRGRSGLASALFGAAEAFCEVLEIASPINLEDYESRIARLRSSYSEWQSAWEAGRKMSMAEVAALVAASRGSGSDSAGTASGTASGSP